VNFLDFQLVQFKLFSLIFMRVTAFMLLVPVFGSRMIPAAVKISVSILLALILTPLVRAPAAQLPDEPLRLGLMAGGEIVVGLVCGFVMFLVFQGVQVAGQIIDMQMGFGVAPPNEKDAVSHRGRAFRAFAEWLVAGGGAC